MINPKILEQVYANQPELICECGATTDGDDLDLIDTRYPGIDEIVYVYECKKCGKTVKETFARVEVEVSEI